MEFKRKVALICSMAIGLTTLIGCGSGSGGSESLPPPSSSQSTLQTSEAKPMVRVGALQGPTGLSLVELMEKNEQKSAENIYTFTLAGAPDEISGKLVSGELDIASVPTNVAATLYAKTEGAVRIIGVNTLGVLYLLHRDPEAAEELEAADVSEQSEEADADIESQSVSESDEDSQSEESSAIGEEGADEEDEQPAFTFADLAGRTIYTTGQGATQEYVLNYLLQQNDVTDAEVVFKSEHAELATLMLEGQAEYALLPQPFVTTVTSKDPAVRVALDITKEWETATGGSQLTMGCVVVRSDFLEKNEEAVVQFLAELADSVDYVNGNVEEAAELAEKFEVISADVAKKAILQCNIVCMTGEEMKDSVAPYLEILESADPKSVGGALPDDEFYYIP